jgi:hypothetical protein
MKTCIPSIRSVRGRIPKRPDGTRRQKVPLILVVLKKSTEFLLFPIWVHLARFQLFRQAIVHWLGDKRELVSLV